MTDKIRECISDIVAIADGPHPRVFDLARERIERLLREFDAQLGDNYFPLVRRYESNLVRHSMATEEAVLRSSWMT